MVRAKERGQVRGRGRKKRSVNRECREKKDQGQEFN